MELPAFLFALVKNHPHREKMHQVCYRALIIMSNVDFECFLSCIVHVHNSLAELVNAASTPSKEAIPLKITQPTPANNNNAQPRKELFLLEFVMKLVELSYNTYSNVEEAQISQFIGEAIDLNIFVFQETSGKYPPLESQSVVLLGKLFENSTLRELFFSARDLEPFLKKFFASNFHTLLAQSQLGLENFPVQLAETARFLVPPEVVDTLIGFMLEKLSTFATNVLQDTKVDENLLALTQGMKILFALFLSDEHTASTVKNKEKEVKPIFSLVESSQSKDSIKQFSRLDELLKLIEQLKK